MGNVQDIMKSWLKEYLNVVFCLSVFVIVYSMLLQVTMSSLVTTKYMTEYFHLGFLLLLFLGRRISIPLEWIPYLVLLAITAFSAALMAVNQEVAMRQLQMYFSVVVFGYCLYFVVDGYVEKIILPVMLAFIFCFFVLAFDVVKYSYFKVHLPWSEWMPDLPYFLDIRHFGYHCFFATTAATIVPLLCKKFRLLSGILVFLCLLVMVWTGGRGTVVAWFVFLFFSGIFILPLDKCLKYWFLGFFLFIAAVILVAMSSSNALVFDMFGRTIDSVQTLNANSISNDRIETWESVVRAIKDKPMLGLGPDGYRSMPERLHGIQPHGILFQLLVEFGWLGGSIVLVIWWKFYRQFCIGVRLFCVPSNDRDMFRFVFLAFINACLVYSLVDGLFYYAFSLFHFCIIVVIARSLYFGVEEKKIELI